MQRSHMIRRPMFATTLLLLVGTATAATAQDDPVARAMAQQALTTAQLALATANAPTVTRTTLVGAESMTTPAIVPEDTISATPIQVNGSVANTTGYSAFKFGNDAKGITNYWVKTRGPTMNSFGAVQLGDRLLIDYWQAGTGGQTGHAGGTQVTIDNATFTAGEVAARWTLWTGTGIQAQQATKQYPNRYAVMNALVANSYQQVLFPGGATGWTPGAGANFGGWVVIGAGAPSPGFGALKFLSAGAALLTKPEAGAFEVDANARPYFTAGDGVRRGIVLADAAPPGVRVLAGAGSGASANIDANGSSGVVTLTTGSGAGAGDLFAVTYAHPYPSASYPVISAANAAAVALVRNGYLSATATGFTLSLPAGQAASASTAYAVTFYAPGR